MPAFRAPILRTALQPSASILPRTQPFVTQIRQYSRGPEGTPEDNGSTPGFKYKLTGAGEIASNKTLIAIGAITAVLGVAYFYMTAKPDAIVAADLKHDKDAIKHQTGSDRQRTGGPERSAK